MRRVKTEATGEAVLELEQELTRRSVEVDNLLKARAEVFLGDSSVDFIGLALGEDRGLPDGLLGRHPAGEDALR